jgi:hypothetical protein
MRKCNDEIYRLAIRTRHCLKSKKKNKIFRPFCLCPPDVMFVTGGFGFITNTLSKEET